MDQDSNAVQSSHKRTMVFGPEPWRADADITWSYWDLWFCAIWTTDFDGDRDTFTEELIRRHPDPLGRPEHEEFLSHLEDLSCRLAAGGLTPAELAGDTLGNKALVAKARRKLLDQGLSDRDLTPAMIDTPRARLQHRALYGRWDRFPVSPERFWPTFAAELDKRARSPKYGLARGLLVQRNRELKGCGTDAACHLGIYRALLAAGLQALEQGIGSGAVAEVSSESLLAYVALPWEETGFSPEDYYGDLCELIVWGASYALLYGKETAPFERASPEHVGLVEGILWSLAEEYGAHRLNHQASHAAEYIAYLSVAKGRFESMPRAAGALGPDGWVAVAAMAKAALGRGRRDLSLAIFAAADRPGILRDNLRRACFDLTGADPASHPPLRLVR